MCVKFVKACWMTSFLNTEQLEIYSCTCIAALPHKHKRFGSFCSCCRDAEDKFNSFRCHKKTNLIIFSFFQCCINTKNDLVRQPLNFLTFLPALQMQFKSSNSFLGRKKLKLHDFNGSKHREIQSLIGGFFLVSCV